MIVPVQQQNSTIASRCSSVHSTSCTPPPALKPQQNMVQRNQSLNLTTQHHHINNTHQHQDARSSSASPAVFNNRTLTPTPTNLVNNNNNNDSLSHTCKRPRLALNQEDDAVNKTWIASHHT